jgi:Glucose / Sorbosone dehydrogenase
VRALAAPFVGLALVVCPALASGQSYRIPADNPFVGQPGAAPEVYAMGLRNPFRFSFDRATGDLLIGDVGQNTWEEVDWATAASGRGAGVNWGWPCPQEPTDDPSCGTPPAFSRNHADGYAAIIGGYVVRDPGLPTLIGRYLYGDAALSSLRSVALPDIGDRAEPLPITALSSFGEDACGRIYAASLSGPVYRVQDGAPTPCNYPAPTAPVVAQGADTTAPHLSVAIRGLRHRRLRLALRCDEACRATIATRLRKVRRLKARHRTLAAGRRTVVRLTLGKKTLRRVRRRLHRVGYVRVRVSVRATDAAGNTRRVTRRGRIAR